MDTKSASGNHTPLLKNEDTKDYTPANMNPPSVVRRGEFRLNRVVFEIMAPLAHTALSLTLAICMVFYLNDSKFDSQKRHSWFGIFAGTAWRASDVTTLVSVALVLIRAVGQLFIAPTVWRCVMILLQHGGLSLGQLDTVLSYRIPTSFSGQYSLLIAVALLMMLPSAYIAPIVSGSVGWEAFVRERSLQAGFGSRPGSESSDYWQRFLPDPNVRWEVTRTGLAHAATLWADIQRSDREASVPNHQFRYIAKDEAVVGTIVEQVPMPYIQVESLTWDKQLSQEVEDILSNYTRMSEHFYTSSGADSNFRPSIGTSELFQVKPLPLPSKVLTGGELYAGREWKIAVLVGSKGAYLAQTGHDNFSCTVNGWDVWGRAGLLDNSDITLLYPGEAEGDFCWAIGTIRLIAGVGTARQGRYVTNRTVEAIEFADGIRPTPDPWAEYAVFMLNDINSQLAHIRSTGMIGGNVTMFTEEVIRHGYIAIRHAFPELEVDKSRQRLKAYSPSPLLQAKVDKWRVWLWLGLNMLLPASWLVVLGVEVAAGGNLRAPALSTGLVPLLTDVREVLVEDENGLSNMSYLTSKDSESFGKIKLGILSTGLGGPPVYGLQAQRGSFVSTAKDLLYVGSTSEGLSKI